MKLMLQDKNRIFDYKLNGFIDMITDPDQSTKVAKTIQFSDDELEYFVAVLRKMTPIKDGEGYSFTATLHNALGTAKEPKELTSMLDRDNIRDMLRLLAHTRSYSKLIAKSAKQMIPWGCNVSLPMRAMKEQHGIKYSEWDIDWTSEIDRLIFPSALYEALNPVSQEKYASFIKELKFTSVDYSIPCARRRALVQTGTYRGSMWHRPLVNLIKLPDMDYDPVVDGKWAELTMIQRHMYLQSWICNPNVRSEDAILDPLDWDNVPEPVEDTIQEPVATSGIKFRNKPKEAVASVGDL